MPPKNNERPIHMLIFLRGRLVSGGGSRHGSCYSESDVAPSGRHAYRLMLSHNVADMDPFSACQKYSHFRILVIGRANAGKSLRIRPMVGDHEER